MQITILGDSYDFEGRTNIGKCLYTRLSSCILNLMVMVVLKKKCYVAIIDG